MDDEILDDEYITEKQAELYAEWAEQVIWEDL